VSSPSQKGRIVSLRRVSGETEAFSDEALVAACASGDPAALAALIERFHLVVYRFIARVRGRDTIDLDDLVQATFLEVARSARRFKGRSQVRTWILGIAANLARGDLRAAVRRRKMEASLIGLPTAAAPRPDEQAERRELIDRLGVALAALPHDLRETFVLCDLEDVKCADAATALGVREGTIWRRLHEARKALRAALEGR
jgi:RNA polymerase sigma-70 factor (ECF subfamily)